MDLDTIFEQHIRNCRCLGHVKSPRKRTKTLNATSKVGVFTLACFPFKRTMCVSNLSTSRASKTRCNGAKTCHNVSLGQVMKLMLPERLNTCFHSSAFFMANNASTSLANEVENEQGNRTKPA